MKKIILLFTIASLSLSAFSQEFDNKFYFRFGYSNPSWSYFDQSKDFWFDNPGKYGVNLS